MKVLFVLNSLAPGGTERSTVVIAPRLRAHGIEPVIVTLKSAAYELDDEVQRAGIPVRRLNPGGLLTRLRELRATIRSEQPDIIHTALFEADQLGRLAAWGTGVPVVSSLVSTPYDRARLQDPNVRRWRLRTVQMIDAITGRFLTARFHAVSEGTKQANARALRLPLNRIVVAERGRDTSKLGVRSPDRRAAVRASLGIGDDGPVVLSLGRLEHQKAQVDLIAATTALQKAYPDLTVLVAGKDGAASGAIRAALDADPATSKHVRLLGHRTDVGDLLCAADALAISSHFEGTAGVALEAMALSTPIVSTDLEGLRGILINDVNALLVPRGEPPALASAIGHVLSEPDLANRLTERAKRDFDDRFTLDAAAERMARLYEEVSRSPL